MTVFIRLLEAEDKAAALSQTLTEVGGGADGTRYEVDPSTFRLVPRSPFAYWITPQVRRVFSQLARVETADRVVKVGVQTFDDFRFLRLAWEHRQSTAVSSWHPFAKGGSYSPFYFDLPLTVEFSNAGRAISVFKYQHRPREGALHRASEYYGRPGLTWPRRSQRGLSVRVMPRGCVFAEKGPAVFTSSDDPDDLLALLGVMNGAAFGELVNAQMAFGSFEVGVIQLTPVPDLGAGDRSTLAALSRRAWSLKRSLDTRTEASHAFVLPALLQGRGETLTANVGAWSTRAQESAAELASIHAEVDELCFALYGLDETRLRTSGENVVRDVPEIDSDQSGPSGETELGQEADEVESRVDAASLAAELVSWAVGAALGRFDVRLATGEREMPSEPEPFNPLPVCSPGMLAGADGLPAQDAPDGYPLGWPRDGVLVDDAGHPEDVAARVRGVLDVVFGEAADAWWQECAQLLGGDLRRWLARSFFEAHLKSYSKSRRKAPIYWQLATPTGSYSVWLYAHRASPDTLYRLLNGFATPKLHFEERRLTGVVQEAGSSPSPSQRRDVESQRAFVEELRAFRAEVARVAPLWRPDLDDGILITCAPLWRLVPQHRAWQRETKACWAKLVKGDYDWAHLAMHLWPERVVPKCAQDRSLAIAHGLEDTFWVERDDGKWAQRGVDATTVDRLVQERSSSAVKAALADLLASG